MTTKRTNKERIFSAAAELDTDQRNAFLDAACRNDDHLRAEVESLLRHDEQASNFIERPALNPPATDLFRPVTEGPGTIIGPYKLLQQIGEGGFGVVYMAEQQRPVRRKVALKIIKPGMDTREVIARFESERQALALMDHPNIARVLDAGATESRRPYFVMELVKGVPITEYCDKNTLPTEKRLELFITICHAVQHAHQKGVIHRDLKPSNVMVTLHDGHPVPKVIDFGVSKATSQQLTEKTLFTAYGQMIGTPAYMSPEQAEMSGLDIDTRSDLYSLGVLLYELLTGTTPFDGKRLREAGYVEMQRIIREEAPPRPSTRISTLGEALTILSSQRSTDPKKLGQQLRGDLDVIVMKALEKERSRRYDTPNAFADDIQRFLNHEAIVARPASTVYRLKKCAQRNWAAVAACAAIAAALLVGTSVSTWLAIRESHASRLAQSERAKAEKSLIEAVTAKSDAQRERDLAEKAKAEESKQRQLALEQKQAAEIAERAATAERTAAVQERDKATAVSAELAKQKEQQRRLLYVAQMNLIQKAWSDDNVSRVQELLNASRPRPGESDLRSIEWHYWQRMLHQEERGFRLPVRLPAATRGSRPASAAPAAQRTATNAFLSGDGSRLAAIVPGDSTREREYVLNVWDTAAGIVEPVFSHTVPQLPISSSRNRSGSNFGTPSVATQYTIAFLDSQRVVLAHSNSRVTSEGEDVIERIRNATPEEREEFIEELRRERQASTEIELQSFPLNSPRDAASQTSTSFKVGPPYIFSRDGLHLATLAPVASKTESSSETILILDGRTGEKLDQLPSPFGSTTLCAISNGAQRLAIAESLTWSAFRTVPGPGGRTPRPASQVMILNRQSRDRITLQPQATSNNLRESISRSRWEFSSDSAHLAVNGRSLAFSAAAVMLFDSATGRELPLANGSQSSFPTRLTAGGILIFSPDGKWLASSPADPDQYNLALWNVPTGKQVPEIKGHAAAPALAAFSADSSRLLTADNHGFVKVWKVPFSVAPTVATRDDVRARFFNPANSPIWNIPSPDGRWTANAPRAVRGGGFVRTEVKLEPPFELKLTDKSRRVPPRVIALPSPAHSLEFSADSTLLVSVCIDPVAKLDEAVELRVWNVTTGQPLPLPIPRFLATEVRIASFSPFPPSGGLQSSRLAQRAPVRDFPTASPVFSPDGRWLATGGRRMNSDGLPPIVFLFDVQGRREIPVALPSLPNRSFGRGSALRFSPDSKLLLVTFRPFSRPAGVNSRSGSQAFQVIAAATGDVLWEVNSTVQNSVVFSADTQRLAAIENPQPTTGISQQSAVVLWEPGTGQELSRIELPPNRVFTSLAISPSGDRVAVQSAGGVVAYEVATKKMLYSLDGITSRLRFTSDGQRLATTASSAARSALPGPPGEFTPAFELPLTSHEDAKVWDAVTGQELLSFSDASPLYTEFQTSDAATIFAPLPTPIEAEGIVDWLSAADADGHFLTRRQIAEQIQTDPSLSAAARTLALQLAAKRLRSVWALAELALEVLHTTGLPREKYQQALEWLEEAMEQSPEEGILFSRQGLAHYRLGDYPAAITSLERSLKLRSAANQPPLPDTLAFLAMTHHQLGHPDQARQFFYQTEREYYAVLRMRESSNSFSRSGPPVPSSNSRSPSSTTPSPFDSLTEAAALLGLKPISELIAEGNSLRTKKEYDKALAKYDEAIAIDPENPLTYLERAGTWQLKSDFDKMIADASAVIHLDPKSHDAHNLRGLGWAGKREDNKAIQDYSAALKLSPRNPVLLGNRATAYRRADNVVLAIADYTEAIKVSTGTLAARYYHRRADTWYAQGEVDLAIEDYANARSLDSTVAVVFTNRALCWLRQGDYDAALKDLTEALSRAPQASENHTNLAAVKFFKGEYAEALASLDQAAHIAPTLAAIRFWRGYVFEKQGQLEKAMAAYDEFLSLSEKPTNGLLDRANCWTFWREYDKAIADYTALLAQEPTHLAGLCGRGRAWAAKGQYENALRDFETAIKAAPNYADGYQALAWLRATCSDEQYRNPEAALAAATKANELSGGKHWKHLDTLAAAYAASGDFAEAIKNEQHALSLFAGLKKTDYQSRLALYHAGKPYIELPAANPISTQLPIPTTTEIEK